MNHAYYPVWVVEVYFALNRFMLICVGGINSLDMAIAIIHKLVSHLDILLYNLWIQLFFNLWMYLEMIYCIFIIFL